MAARTLRHYRKIQALAPAAGNETAVPAVAPARALVVSKLTAINAHSTTAAVIHIGVGPDSSSSTLIAANLTIAPGEIYSESGLVLLTGESLFFFVVSGPGSGNIVVQVSGEEVDN